MSFERSFSFNFTSRWHLIDALRACVIKFTRIARFDAGYRTHTHTHTHTRARCEVRFCTSFPYNVRFVIPYSFSVGRLLASGRSRFSIHVSFLSLCVHAELVKIHQIWAITSARGARAGFPVFAKDSKIGYSFSVYFRPVYTDRGDQRMGGGGKKAIRNIACLSISGRMVTDVWWRIYFICQTLGHRWTENSSNVNRNILKQCLHGNN